MIFAFMGEYKSGKDYFAEYLAKTQGAVRLSFSDQVRVLANQLFPWLPVYVSPENKDQPFTHPNNPNNLTPRDIWLVAGKVRDVDPNFFVNQFIETHDHILDQCFRKDNLYIITDFRTPNEWDFLKAARIPVIKIELEDRSHLPPSDFEEYVRQFQDYDAYFLNSMNGTSEFDEFFNAFKDNYARKQ
jgi:hypothetical protein